MSYCDHSSSVIRRPSVVRSSSVVLSSTPLNNFSSKTPRPFFLEILPEPFINGELKSYTKGRGPLIKMAAMAIYRVKTLKNLLQNQESLKAEY